MVNEVASTLSSTNLAVPQGQGAFLDEESSAETAVRPASALRAGHRLLIVVRTLQRRGGIEAHVLDSIPLLQDAGFDICVLTADENTVEGNLSCKTVSIPSLKRPRLPPDALEDIEAVIEDFQPATIHVQQLADASCVETLRRAAPVVWSVHNYDPICMAGQKHFGPGEECYKPHGPGCLMNVLLRGCDHRRVPRPSPLRYQATGRRLQALTQADTVIGYSGFVCEQLKLNQLKNVVHVPLFADSPVPHRAGKNRDRVLFVGRVVPQKGLHVLLEALAMTPAATLDVCGDGWGMPRIKALSEALGVSGRVNFNGWQSQESLSHYYESADLVAMPSIWPEPFGLAGIDALRHGRPVIASETGGIRDWLRDGDTGLLVPAGDSMALAAAIRRLLANPSEGDRMGRRGAADVARRFTPAGFVKATSASYLCASQAWNRTLQPKSGEND